LREELPAGTEVQAEAFNHAAQHKLAIVTAIAKCPAARQARIVGRMADDPIERKAFDRLVQAALDHVDVGDGVQTRVELGK
jgi:hypothetical protein